MLSRSSVFALRLFCVLFASSIAFVFSDNVQAATYTWQTGTFGEWNDASRWSGGPAGTVPGAGDTAIITSGQVRLQNNVTVGTLNWSGGRISDVTGNTVTTRLLVTTALNISGTDAKYIATDSQSGSFAIESQGTATWTGTGDIGTTQFSGATGKMELYNFGNFNIQNDELFSADFINSGTTTKQSGAGTCNFTRPVYNLGTIRSQSGILNLSGGGDIGSGSTYDASAGAILALSGTHELLSGTSTFSGAGRIKSNNGTLSIIGGAGVNVTGTLESGSISGAGLLNVTGTLDWMGGQMIDGVTSIESGGQLNIKGGSLSNNRIINNKGTTTWSSGSPSVSNGAVFNNRSGGTFKAQLASASTFGSDDATSAFNNETGATVTQNGAQATFSIPFNNNGITSVQTGSLKFQSGGTSTGTFHTTVGTDTVFAGNNFNPKSFTHNNGTKFTGLGGVSVSDSGKVNIGVGATVDCDSSYSVQDFTSLLINLDGVFNAKGNFGLRGGTVDGLGTLKITGRMDWNDGTMKGTGSTDILAGGELLMQGQDSNSALSLDIRTINNSGTTTITGTSSFADFLRMSNGATFNNKSGGIVNIQHDGYFSEQNSSGANFDNQFGAVINCNVIGSALLQGGGISAVFTNNGTVNVQQGTFYVGGGGQGAGKFNVSTGATLSIQSDLYTANAGTTLMGGGTTAVHDGTGISIPTGATLVVPTGHTLRLASRIDGGGQLTINGTLDWQSGDMKGGGITRINAGGTSTWTAGEFDQGKDLLDRTFNNFGTVIWTGDNINLGQGAQINNESGANFIINTDRNMQLFSNENPQEIFRNKAGATLTKSGGTATQLWQVPFTNAGSVFLQSGTLNFQIFNGNYIQTGGFTNLLGGNLSSTQFNGTRSTIDIQGGTVTGIGTINADLDNNGRIQPGQTAGVPGVLAISGNYTQTANGKLDIEIGGPAAGTQYDQLQVGGAVALDGLLTIVHLNNFAPSLADTFQVMTYASRSGSFSLSGTDYGVLVLKPIYNATNLTLVPKQRTIGIDDAFVTEGTGGTVTAKFTVFLSDVSGQSITVDFTTANGSATAPGDYVATSGTVTISPGLISQTISVTVQGDALDEDNEKFFVNLSNPSGAIFEDDQAECTITDNDAAPTISIRDLSVAEGASGFTNAAFTVVLSAASGKEVKVNFTSIDGSALAPGDYTAVSGTLIFAPGVTTRTINVPIKGDLLDEPNETYRINLTTPVNATIADNQALGTIRDDDPTPSLAINSVTLIEGHTGTKNAVFTVTLSAPSGQTVSVSAITSDGTARAPADYTATGLRLTFTPGQVSKIVNVPVKGDVLDEVNETFFVILSSPGNAAIGTGRGVGTINDDDAPPSISIDDLSIGEGNAGQRIAALRLKLSAPSGQAVRVNAATANGTALAGTTAPGATGASDYVALPSTQISFNVNSVFAYARVTINGDVLPEANETFLVNLSNPVNATIADNQGIGTILNDDQAPSLSINDVSVAEGNAGTKVLTFIVTLSKASAQAVSVKFASADGTARSTSDYVAQSGTLSFAPGSALTRTISIIINGDTLVENDETVFVLLSASVNASIGKARGVGTILNDDVSG